MTALDQIRRLWQHARWADVEVLGALRSALVDAASPALRAALAAAVREYAHLVAAEEVWLARLERRAPRSPVWPELTADEAAALGQATGDGYGRFLDRLTDGGLREPVAYTTSAGQAFATPVDEILLHVALHGQYHRGKVNLLLRQGGREPAPVDYIAFVRGAPAARTAVPTPPR